MRKTKFTFLLLISLFLINFILSQEVEDPYLWLEDILGQKALEWVKAQNQESISKLEAVPIFKGVYEKTLQILDSPARIPYVSIYGNYLYNFWRDAQHPRGLWRRSTIEKYRKREPEWEIVLDLDDLAKEEKENWVWRDALLLYPDYDRALVMLSRGGADASVVREFDIPRKSFVKDGFQLPEAKSRVAWIDRDRIFVGTDFGPDSLTTSGYPRIVKIWRRGEPLEEAEKIYEGQKTSVSATGYRLFSEDGNIDFIVETPTFFTSIYYILKDGKLKKLKLPSDAEIEAYFRGQLLIRLKKDWNVDGKLYKQGSVIVGKLEDILSEKIDFQVLIEPTDYVSIQGVSRTKNYILVTVLDNVVSKLYRFSQGEKGKWEKKEIKIGDKGTISIASVDEKIDEFFLNYENFLTPSALYFVSAKTMKIEKIKSMPEFFNSNLYRTLQFHAISKDGTKVPYFVIISKKAKFNGKNPTLLYGYGGFEIALRPSYLSVVGVSWLEKGGVYVVANIRGGGEFGPKWHQAALKKNRHKAYEDFIAVAEDLVKRKITSSENLGIMGGSNGGLLVGAVSMMRPDLFKAVVCQVPLLDMKRYSKLLAGASWIDEYGDPDDPDMWNYIKTYSPYHNVKKDVKYPKIFFTTSTRDDRVHPGHARKMTAKMKDMRHEVYYYENTEGGHAGAATNAQRAYMTALAYSFLYLQLMGY
ncbi:MAG: prolyl oligopeptidase family serine peptidase [Candidatus Aminicenantia bacterium]